MTVQKLIKLLQKMPPKAPVIIYGEWGSMNVDEVKKEKSFGVTQVELT